jgi:hypothetical protein
MSLNEQRLPRYLTGEAFPTPTPANDNWGVKGGWLTPAEAMQWVRRWKLRACRELVADPSLWACPKHRLTRAVNDALEKCLRWHCYGER